MQLLLGCSPSRRGSCVLVVQLFRQKAAHSSHRISSQVPSHTLQLPREENKILNCKYFYSIRTSIPWFPETEGSVEFLHPAAVGFPLRSGDQISSIREHSPWTPCSLWALTDSEDGITGRNKWRESEWEGQDKG